MCGRKTLVKVKENIIRTFSVDQWEAGFDWKPHYNIAPMMQVPVLLYNGVRVVKPMMWGLIPSWSKDEKIAGKLINARAETLLQRPSFSNLVRRNRCIVITDGYYEWKKVGNVSVPFYVRDRDCGFLPMAGLYDIWRSPGGDLRYTYVVITVESSPELKEIHHRMPAIINMEDVEKWINWRKYLYSEVCDLLKPYEGKLEFYPVSRVVNYSRNNSPLCIERVDYP